MKPMPGYIMVDATGLDVSDTEAQTVDGLYDKLVAALATGKEILFTGVVNGDAEYPPSPATCTMGETGVAIIIPAFSAVVSDDDEVTPIT